MSNSIVCGKSELSLFEKDPPQVVIEKGLFCDIHPTSSLDANTTNIEFLISGSQNEYLDLNDTILYLRLKVFAKGGARLAADAQVNLADYSMNALFKDVTLTLNNTVVEGGNHMYPYKATIEDILNYDSATSKIQLTSSGCFKDEDDKREQCRSSKMFELVGALRLDFLNQPKYLLPAVDVRIALQKSNETFSIQCHTANVDPYIEINQAILYVRRVSVSPSVEIAHDIGLRTQNAIYPYQRSKIITYSIGKGSLTYFKDNLFSGLLPKFVIIGFVKSLAFAGSYQQEPFEFESFGVRSIGLFRDGQSVPYRTLYEPDFKNGLYLRDHLKSIIQNMEHLNKNINNGVTSEMFANGYALFTFNLTPDLCVSQAQKDVEGNLRLDVKFDKGLAEPINVVAYALFDGEIQITKDRKVICDHK